MHLAKCAQHANVALQSAGSNGSITLSPLQIVLVFVLGLLFVVVCALIVYLLVNAFRREPHNPYKYLEILKERLAKGEVSVEDFDAAKSRLV